MRELAEHVTAELAPYCPPRVSIQVDAERIALHERGRLHCTVTVPDVSDPLECGRVVLGAVQDLLCEHLHSAWPLLPDGRATYAWSERNGGQLKLAFRPRDGAPGIELAPFAPVQWARLVTDPSGRSSGCP